MIPWLTYWTKHYAYQAVVLVLSLFLYPVMTRNIDWMMAVITCKDCTLPTTDELNWEYFGMPVTPTYICVNHAHGNMGQSSGGNDMMIGVAVGVMMGSAMSSHHN